MNRFVILLLGCLSLSMILGAMEEAEQIKLEDLYAAASELDDNALGDFIDGEELFIAARLLGDNALNDFIKQSSIENTTYEDVKGMPEDTHNNNNKAIKPSVFLDKDIDNLVAGLTLMKHQGHEEGNEKVVYE